MEAMHADNSRIGASFLSKRAIDNPRELLVKLYEDNPSASKDDLFKMFCDAVEDESGYLRAVKWYFFVNMYEYATRPTRSGTAERASEKKQQMQRASEAIIRQIVMLDLTMTNGKLLGDCTGPELAKMGSKFQKLAARVGKKTAREVLTEDQVKEIMK